MPDFDFSTFPVLETERLRLRRILPADIDTWLAIFTHPDVRRYLVDIDDNTEFETVKEIVEWADMIFANKSGIRWAITLKPDDTMIGSCGFHVYDAHNQHLEIGYELSHAYWRKGIMTEACQAVLNFCFDELDVHRIEADVTVGNEASAGLLTSLGFVQEGTWRDRVFANGKFHSLWQFAILKNEYQR